MARFLVGYNSKGQAVLAASAFPYVDLRGSIPGNAQPLSRDRTEAARHGKPLERPKGTPVGPRSALRRCPLPHAEELGLGLPPRLPRTACSTKWPLGTTARSTASATPAPSSGTATTGSTTKSAFSNTFLIGKGQYPTAAALRSMAELNAAQLELVGLSDDYCFGHLDIGFFRLPRHRLQRLRRSVSQGRAFRGVLRSRSRKSIPQPKTGRHHLGQLRLLARGQLGAQGSPEPWPRADSESDCEGD